MSGSSAAAGSSSPIRSTSSAGPHSRCPAGRPRTACPRPCSWPRPRAPTPACSRPGVCSHPSSEGRLGGPACRKRGMRMVRTRLVICLAAAVLVGTLAGSARSGVAGPTGLHGFLLRADEPTRTAFTRTPAFAWSPVPGALHYEFQLSLSGTFRDNSVVYADNKVLSPVLAPDLTLPWITGDPHSLYARVRAVTPTGATPWSAAYGFDMVPPTPPTPLPTYPGLLRWTPIEGAAAYQVWLVDAKKMEIVSTNVLDEREFYTFHQIPSWMSTVRWRIRVLRTDVNKSGRINTIPAAQYGPWSQTYSSTNPPFTNDPPFGDGKLKLIGTISDVFSNGSAGSPSHRLMP